MQTSSDTRVGYGAVLDHSEGRAIVAAHAVSLLGTVAGQVALAVLIYARTNSPLLSSLTLAFAFIPQAFAGAFLSAIADRYPPRRTLIRCDLASAALIALAAVPGMPIPIVLMLVLLLSTVATVFTGTRAGTLADLFPDPSYVTARSLMRLTSQGALVVGFAAGGLALAVLSPVTLLLGDALTFLGSALMLRFGTQARPARDTAGGTGLWRDSLIGVRTVWRIRPLRLLMLLCWLPPAFAATPDGLAPAYVAEIAGKPSTVAAMFTAFAVGMVLGEVGALRLSPATRRRLIVPLAVFGQLPLLCFLAAPDVPIVLGLLLLVGASMSYAQGLDQLVLDATPLELRGRVLTVQSAGLMCGQGMLIGLAGAAAEVVRPGLVVAAAGAVGVVVILNLGRSLRTSAPHRAGLHRTTTSSPSHKGCTTTCPPCTTSTARQPCSSAAPCITLCVPADHPV